VDPVPDPLLLRKSGSAENRTRTTRVPVLRHADNFNRVVLALVPRGSEACLGFRRRKWLQK
jgi:hypothetical protein